MSARSAFWLGRASHAPGWVTTPPSESIASTSLVTSDFGISASATTVGSMPAPSAARRMISSSTYVIPSRLATTRPISSPPAAAALDMHTRCILSVMIASRASRRPAATIPASSRLDVPARGFSPGGAPWSRGWPTLAEGRQQPVGARLRIAQLGLQRARTLPRDVPGFRDRRLERPAPFPETFHRLPAIGRAGSVCEEAARAADRRRQPLAGARGRDVALTRARDAREVRCGRRHAALTCNAVVYGTRIAVVTARFADCGRRRCRDRLARRRCPVHLDRLAPGDHLRQ